MRTLTATFPANLGNNEFLSDEALEQLYQQLKWKINKETFKVTVQGKEIEVKLSSAMISPEGVSVTFDCDVDISDVVNLTESPLKLSLNKDKNDY